MIHLKRQWFGCVLMVGMLLGGPATLAQSSVARNSSAKRPVPVEDVRVVPAKPGAFHPLTVGERLGFSVKYNNLVAARILLTVVGQGEHFGREGIQVSTRFETVGLVRATLLSATDKFVTYLDPTTRLPYRAERDIKEGQKVESGVTLFDQTKGTAVIEDQKEIRLDQPTHDLYGLLWTFRNLDFKAGKIQRLVAIEPKSGKLYRIELEQLGTEKQLLGEKEIETVRFAIRSEDKSGKMTDDLKVRLWVTNDAKRYPVLLTATPPFGAVRVELTKYPGKAEEAADSDRN